MFERPPDRPLLVFDGDCSFCRVWVEYWQQISADRVIYAPYQEVGDCFPDIRRQQFKAAVQFVLPDGKLFGGAHAVFRLLTLVRGDSSLLWLYEKAPGFAPIANAVYALIARHRSLAYRVTRFLWGVPLASETFGYASWIFLRLLGIFYLIAFLSLGVQASGIIGSKGISPTGAYLQAAGEYFGTARFLSVPTLLWLHSSDAMIRTMWLSGAVCAVLLLLGAKGRSVRVALFVLYLSLVTAGREFMMYQWDALLLEAGFLAIFLGSSTLIVKLFRWLLFRLMFLSGAVKLLSHDPAWHGFTAIPVHYETQPLPTPMAWYFYQFPPLFQHVSVGFVFFVELFIPFLIFSARRLRVGASIPIVFLQILIAVTGNYAFFNLLTVALCVFLLDDIFLRRCLRDAITSRIPKSMPEKSPRPWVRRSCLIIYVLVLFTSAFEIVGTFSDVHWTPADKIIAAAAPFEIVNTYGLFAVMTTTRQEIVIEGSDDGMTWLAYEFKYKPGDLARRPSWVAPHQPRLDWQMWFAALGDYHSNPWILRFMMRLLEGSPEVVHLLLSNPFPDSPPHYLRALLYQYQFTNSHEKRTTGNWWKRQSRGEYVPAISLRTLSAVNALNLVTSNESQHFALPGVWDCHPGFRSHSFAAPLGGCP